MGLARLRVRLRLDRVICPTRTPPIRTSLPGTSFSASGSSRRDVVGGDERQARVRVVGEEHRDDRDQHRDRADHRRARREGRERAAAPHRLPPCFAGPMRKSSRSRIERVRARSAGAARLRHRSRSGRPRGRGLVGAGSIRRYVARGLVERPRRRCGRARFGPPSRPVSIGSRIISAQRAQGRAALGRVERAARSRTARPGRVVEADVGRDQRPREVAELVEGVDRAAEAEDRLHQALEAAGLAHRREQRARARGWPGPRVLRQVPGLPDHRIRGAQRRPRLLGRVAERRERRGSPAFENGSSASLARVSDGAAVAAGRRTPASPRR